METIYFGAFPPDSPPPTMHGSEAEASRGEIKLNGDVITCGFDEANLTQILLLKSSRNTVSSA